MRAVWSLWLGQANGCSRHSTWDEGQASFDFRPLNRSTLRAVRNEDSSKGKHRKSASLFKSHLKSSTVDEVQASLSLKGTERMKEGLIYSYSVKTF